jgi:aminoglycoside phosphotransferase (APT) family kinase protein
MKTDHRLLEGLVRRVTGARTARVEERVQSLWSGYGEVLRVALEGADPASVIVKHVEPPPSVSRRMSAAEAHAHQRKLRSYAVETAWYRDYAARCDVACRVPRCFGLREDAHRRIFILEDLDASGFDQRWTRHDPGRIEAGLRWLAAFHGTFLGVDPAGLWPVGTYWHLATRRDEYARMRNGPLKCAASAIDERLNGCRFKTIVHGDAKIENFCFAKSKGQELPRVAAVDFQYVGAGCAMKDVIYFLSSVLTPDGCRAEEAALLEIYWEALAQRLGRAHPAVEFEAVRAEWRALYPYAWADFQRFLEGWMSYGDAFEVYAADWVHLALEKIGRGSGGELG